MLQLRVLGTFEVREAVTSEPIALPSKRAALLIYLALARPGSRHRRDTLLGLFWPESGEERARHALSQALYVLKTALGSEVIRTHGHDEVELDLGGIWCDAREMDAAVEAGDWKRAVELYTGDLLPGFFVSGCLEFDQWLEVERTRLRDQAIRAARALAEGEFEAGNPVGAVHWLRRATKHAPYDEELRLLLIELLHRVGDQAGALREYEAFAQRLEEDLDLAPSPDVMQLVASIRKAPVRGPRPDRAPLRETGPEVDRAPDPDHAPMDGEAIAGSLLPDSGAPPSKGTGLGRQHRIALVVLLLMGAAGLTFLVGSTEEGEQAGAAGDGWVDRRVLVMPFTNETGDPELGVLGSMAADWIADGLARTGVVQVVPLIALPPSFLDAPRWNPGTQDLDTSGDGLARITALADDLDARLVVTGSYYREGDSVLVQARITDVRAGHGLRRVDPVTVQPTSPMSGVELLSRRVAGALATALDLRMEAWTASASLPPSFDAYSQYAAGIDLYMRSEWSNAARQFRRAALEDPTFTAPLVWAAMAHGNAQENEEAEALVSELEGRMDELAPWDRTVLHFVSSRLRADPMGSYRAAREIVRIAPNSEWIFFLATSALQVNRPWEALEHLAKLDPDRGWLGDQTIYWTTLAWAQHLTADYEGELRTVEELGSRWPQADPARPLWPLIGLGRTEEVFDSLDHLLATRSPSGSWGTLRFTVRLVGELSVHGHGSEADVAAQTLLDWGDTAAPEVQERLFHRAQQARLLLHLGRDAEARALLEELERDDPGVWEFTAMLAILAARDGDHQEAIRRSTGIAEAWEGRDHGEATLWRASIAAHMGDLPTAMDLVRTAFADGLNVTLPLHYRTDLNPLRDHPPFQELMRPRR